MAGKAITIWHFHGVSSDAIPLHVRLAGLSLAACFAVGRFLRAFLEADPIFLHGSYRP
jgi:hypothetical protein